MSEIKTWMGVDVSKQTLEMYLRPLGQRWQIPNREEAIQSLADELRKHPPVGVVLEATGGFEHRLVELFQGANLPVAVINPRQGRDFARALGRLAKTDRIDAETLAHFAESVKPEPQKRPEASQQNVKDLMSRRQQLVEMLTQEKNRPGYTPGFLRPGLEQHIRWLQKQLGKLDEGLHQRMQSHPVWQQKGQWLETVPGVGPVLGMTLLSQLPELGTLNRKEIAAPGGVAPLNCESGAWKGKRHVWGGRKSVRCALYMGTMSAIRFNPVIRVFYQRLRQAGKTGKVALVACMRKLLVILNALIKHQCPWRQDEWLVDPRSVAYAY